ncbi:Fcf1-domain-containing protein [Lineolata rhizophorae]|uniref:U three protein 23 n=1 Tax=Lineolata rhizophorae TaxID=578093 RepID=A0A6A6P822_9PEZI|nr:Fcf1-domain-containing protein [Lineolata rhizophorae]
MRGKRAKQYRKMMHRYGITFGFREPYQVLIDAQMIQDTARFKMDLVPALERTLQGKVKPMITQCTMRHLYELAQRKPKPPTKRTEPSAAPPLDPQPLIALARTFERRRCNHHTLPAPLSTPACLLACIDPSSAGANKHRYVVATQDADFRAQLRNEVAGVPLVYVSRSVMVMEPMGKRTVDVREGVERGKLRRGFLEKEDGKKRKREEGAEGMEGGEDEEGSAGEEQPKKKNKVKGPKGPNPLSVKKPKKREQGPQEGQRKMKMAKMEEVRDEKGGAVDEGARAEREQSQLDGTRVEEGEKRKRKRKHKSSRAIAEAVEANGEAPATVNAAVGRLEDTNGDVAVEA